MDGSFLSDERLVAATRGFVCIRLATYEDAEEALFLRGIFAGRDGQLENTVFCLLGPDGRQRLSRSGRSPHFAFRDVASMVESMHELTERYPYSILSAGTDTRLPVMKSVALGLNVAACDRLPIIVTYSPDAAKLEALNQRLLSLAWTEELAGQYIYVSTTQGSELRIAVDEAPVPGIYVLKPDDFGVRAKTLGHFKHDEQEDRLQRELARIAANTLEKTKNTRRHIAEGHRRGIEWESEIPVTDAHAIQARRSR